jgi:hypothetical protein
VDADAALLVTDTAAMEAAAHVMRQRTVQVQRAQ